MKVEQFGWCDHLDHAGECWRRWRGCRQGWRRGADDGPLQAGPGGEIRLGLVAGIDAEEAEADSGKYAV